ncbi:DoxX family protein [Nocardia abscessus]|uniref:DoxX family protein n=1 Tax=Nocardia abscessus TaxID=120957 RepID=UPI0002F157BB|nr:DoxX family protein [Nocardia abscessus]MCC3331137.1 DoxX family protein [Nocardia abscessus]
MTEQRALHTMKTTTFQHATAEKSAVARSDRTRIRALAYWATTFVIVFELVSGSVWNLLTIEWIEIQLRHLGYPHFFAYILGAWQVGAAVAIIAPGFALIKEWAYAGAFLLWSGAVVSHLAVGDGVESWSVPLMFAICAIASWMLRPACRRLPQMRLRPDRTAAVGQAGPGLPATRPRDWTVAIGGLVVLYAVSFLTLPTVEDFMHKNAVELGWISE